MKYVVQYIRKPFEYRVQVGIQADSEEDALEKARDLYRRGTIWQDTEEVPLIYDDYDGDPTPVFSVVRKLEDGAAWPRADFSVRLLRRNAAAMDAARFLLEAYRRGQERGGSIDWDDLDQAYEAARKACGEV